MSKSKLVRLQKFIADCGITSRRKAEDLIVMGRVTVNGDLVKELGTKVDPSVDAVMVDGKVADLGAVEKIYMVMNKPRGIMTTVHDPEGRKTVLDLCQEISERIYPVGRLDYLSEGLLILSNDGELANDIIHPSSNIVKVYEVKVFGSVTENILNTLRNGVHIDGVKVAPKSVRVIGQLPTKTWLEFRISEGKNREIRRMCEAAELTVDKLRRVAIGGLAIEGISPGNYRLLSKKQLQGAIGLTAKTDEPKEYFSTKKSISLKKKGAQPGTTANDSAFQKFRKDTYFDSIKNIAETKKLKAKKEREESYKIKEAAHEKRVQKKKKRAAKKRLEQKHVHAEFVK